MNPQQSKPFVVKQININTSPDGYTNVNGTIVNNFTYTNTQRETRANISNPANNSTTESLSDNTKPKNSRYTYTTSSGSRVNVNYGIGGAANIMGNVYNFK